MTWSEVAQALAPWLIAGSVGLLLGAAFGYWAGVKDRETERAAADRKRRGEEIVARAMAIHDEALRERRARSLELREDDEQAGR